MYTFVTASRNIMRNPRRTAVTVTAVALNTAVMIFIFAMSDGLFAQLIYSSTHTYVGDVQLHAPGYRFDRSIYNSLPEPDSLLQTAMTAGFSATARSFGTGLVSSSANSSGASYWGIDPKSEKITFEIAQKIQHGRFLSDEPQKEVVIGQRLAHSLSAEIGSEIIAVVQAADGSLGNDLYTVAGILKSVGSKIDRGGILMHSADFDHLFVAGGRVHQIALLAGEHGTPEGAANLYDRHQKNKSLVVESWRELLPALSDMLVLQEASIVIVAFIFLLAASMGVLNTMFMATHDRVYEFGMLIALGTRPWRIVRDVLMEALLLGTVSAFFGALLGGAVSFYFQTTGGMDLTTWQGNSLEVSGIIYDPVYQFALNPARILTAVLSMCTMCMLASLFPAIKAACLNPVAALTHK